jgi:hypothetical protein
MYGNSSPSSSSQEFRPLVGPGSVSIFTSSGFPLRGRPSRLHVGWCFTIGFSSLWVFPSVDVPKPNIIRGCIQKSPERVDNEINNNNKHSLRSNTKDYGSKTQNSDTNAPSGRELYHLQFSLQVASAKTFG